MRSGLPETMRALVWVSKGRLEIREKPTPAPGEGEILIRVESTGICGSDLKISDFGNSRVPTGRTLGHETVGTVVKTGGAATNLPVGSRVAIGADFSCESCVYCQTNRINLCHENLAIGHQIDGGFSEFLLLPSGFVTSGPIEDIGDLSPDIACLSEPLACVLNGVGSLPRGLEPRFPGDSCVILGAGPVGMLFARLALRSSFEHILVADVSGARLSSWSSMAGERISLFHLDEESNMREHFSSLDTLGAGLVICANSSMAARQTALEIAGRGGVVSFFGGLPGEFTMTMEEDFIHYKQISLVGSHGSDSSHFRESVTLLREDPDFWSGIVTDKYPLGSFEAAFEQVRSGGGLKVLFTFEGKAI